ncbi:MAG TPA: hypothetical protein VN540_04385 [Clostridia bacterium]|nr:hypothetical protein [Clostridia bacterium]
MEDVYRMLLGPDAPAWRERPPALDYRALAARVTALLPEAGEADVSTKEGFALARMKTLSRKPHAGFPEDEGVRRALWLCVGAIAFPNEPARARARLRAAAEATMNLARGVPPREREALRSRLGEAADVMARLLDYAIHQKGG